MAKTIRKSVHRLTLTDADEIGQVTQVPVALLDDGTSVLILDPDAVTFANLTRALADVAPARTAPAHLRRAWHCVRANMLFASRKAGELAGTPWYAEGLGQAHQKLHENAALLARVRDQQLTRTMPTLQDPEMQLPAARGTHARFVEYDYLESGFAPRATATEANPPLVTPPLPVHGEGTLEEIYASADTHNNRVVLVNAGGSGECFFCAIGWQFDTWAPYKWREYERKYSMPHLWAGNPMRNMFLRALGVLGWLRSLTDENAFTLDEAMAYGLDQQSSGLAEYTRLFGMKEPFGAMVARTVAADTSSDSLAEKESRAMRLAYEATERLLRRFVAHHIAFLPPQIDLMAANLNKICRTEMSYATWAGGLKFRTPSADTIRAFGTINEVPLHFDGLVTAVWSAMMQSMRYLMEPYSYVSTPHVKGIAQGLRISLVTALYETETVESVIEVPGANFVAMVTLSGATHGGGGHYWATVRAREYAHGADAPNKTRMEAEDFRYALQAGAGRECVPYWSFERDGLKAEQYTACVMRYGAPRGFSHRISRARRILFETGDTDRDASPLLASMFVCATYSFYHTAGIPALFARVFAAIMTQPTGGMAPMDHVRYLHRVVANLKRHYREVSRASGENLFKPALDALRGKADLPPSKRRLSFAAILGLPVSHFDVPAATEEALHKLGEHVALMVTAAANAAMVAVLHYFAALRPLADSYDGMPMRNDAHDYLYDDDVNRRLTEAAGIPVGDTTKEPVLFQTLARRSRMFGFEMTMDMRREVFLFARAFVTIQPSKAGVHMTAFHEHASVLLRTLATRAEGYGNQTTLAPAPLQAQMPRAGATEMQFRAGENQDADFIIDVTVKQATPTPFTRRYHDKSSSRLVAWLTRAPGVDIASYEADKPGSFERYMRHVQMATAPLRDGSISSIVMRLRGGRIMDAQRRGPVFLHIAHMVLETSETDETQRLWVRSGHGFVNVAALSEEGVPLVMALWEGPIESAFAWDVSAGFRVTRDMTYKRTHLLSVSIQGPVCSGLLEPSTGGNMPPPPIDRPNTLYTASEAAELVRYIAGTVKRLPPGTSGEHSLLYLNMPMDRVAVPNWVSLLLPPIGVSAAMLEARVAGKLYDEALSAGEFVQIAALAAGTGPLRRYARDRIEWIMSQIVNPFNKVCYRYDRIDGASNDQMQFPLWGNGDCEDTAEGVVRYIRGLKAIPAAGLTPAAAVVARYLADYEPAMTVLTTKGAKLAQTAGPKGLHMMAILLPVGPRREGLNVVPVETTGLNFNSYLTPDMLLEGAPEAERAPIIAATRAYTRICAAACRVSAATKKEKINYAVLVNAEGGTSRTKGDCFVRPHHFYDSFIMLMRPSAPGFSDFVRADGGVGVTFADAVLGTGPAWHAAAVSDAAATAGVLPLCQRFANNVMPAPDFAGVSRIDDLATQPRQALPPAQGRSLLAVRSVNFFIPTTMTSRAEVLIEELARALPAAAGPDIERIDPVERVTVLGGAIEYYVLRVRIASAK
jgi:hypothetical protein